MIELTKEQQHNLDDQFSDEEYFQYYKLLCQVEKIAKAIREIYIHKAKSEGVLASRLYFFYMYSLLDRSIVPGLNNKKQKQACRKDLFDKSSLSYWKYLDEPDDFEQNFYIQYLGKSKHK